MIEAKEKNQLIVLAAGGTGGHVFPAEALASELISRGYELALLTDKRAQAYKGTLGSLNRHIIFSSKPLTHKYISFAASSIFTAVSIISAWRVLKTLSPSLVVGFGGYVSLPTIIAARFNRISTIIHEQNAVLGRANQILAPMAKNIATSFPETKGTDSYQGKVTQTGNPVREEIITLCEQSYEPPEKSGTIRLLVLGGSQGAASIDNFIPAAIAKLPKSLTERLYLTHQSRLENVDLLRNKFSQLGIKANVQGFYRDIASKISESHLVIARAGASTISEISVMGKPALLIPYPRAIGQHQKRNAIQFSRNSACEILEEKNFSSEFLAEKMAALLSNTNKLKSMAKASKNFGRPHAAKELADLVEEVSPRSGDKYFKSKRPLGEVG
tara:strand:+ start:19463 stop:20620 length:1158 start_codon:yes stop_codon:yes gene_type:complete